MEAPPVAKQSSSIVQAEAPKIAAKRAPSKGPAKRSLTVHKEETEESVGPDAEESKEPRPRLSKPKRVTKTKAGARKEQEPSEEGDEVGEDSVASSALENSSPVKRGALPNSQSAKKPAPKSKRQPKWPK